MHVIHTQKSKLRSLNRNLADSWLVLHIYLPARVRSRAFVTKEGACTSFVTKVSSCYIFVSMEGTSILLAKL